MNAATCLITLSFEGEIGREKIGQEKIGQEKDESMS
jgi:hypothetical protein